MSKYNNTNTKILAEHPQDTNTRMLLLHTCGDGRLEYIIGSYFTEKWGDGNVVEYSWDWGHYFGDVFEAVNYWRREVLWREVELYRVHDAAEKSSLEGCTLQVMRTNDGWSACMYGKDMKPTTYHVSAFESKEHLIRAFENRHRPSCWLESMGSMER